MHHHYSSFPTERSEKTPAKRPPPVRKISPGASRRAARQNRDAREFLRGRGMTAANDSDASTVHTPLPSWRNLDTRTKIITAQDAIAENDNAKPFTINLDHLIKGKARTSIKGVRDFISHRVNKHLKQVADRVGHPFAYWFVIETSPAGVLHIHGIIIANSNELPLIEAAFRNIAGPYAIAPKTRPGRHAVEIAEHDHTKSFRGFSGALGWGAYALKQITKTERTIGQCPVVMSHPMNRIAHDHWEAIRSGGGGVDAFVPSATATASAASPRKSPAPIGGRMITPAAQDPSTRLLRPSSGIDTESATAEGYQRPASPPRRARPKASRPCPLAAFRSRSRNSRGTSGILRRLSVDKGSSTERHGIGRLTSAGVFEAAQT